jgi:hypothetical protein
VHVWTERKISEQQKAYAAAANALSARIHKLLAESYRRPSCVPSATAQLGNLPFQLAFAEARLWAASQTAVKDINGASAALLTGQLRDVPFATAVAMTEGHARFVQEALQTLTSIQSHTMLTYPQVALTVDIAKDCQQVERNGSTIDHRRYSAWRASALADVER